jgi:hypothetical protein
VGRRGAHTRATHAHQLCHCVRSHATEARHHRTGAAVASCALLEVDQAGHGAREDPKRLVHRHDQQDVEAPQRYVACAAVIASSSAFAHDRPPPQHSAVSDRLTVLCQPVSPGSHPTPLSAVRGLADPVGVPNITDKHSPSFRKRTCINRLPTSATTSNSDTHEIIPGSPRICALISSATAYACPHIRRARCRLR